MHATRMRTVAKSLLIALVTFSAASALPVSAQTRPKPAPKRRVAKKAAPKPATNTSALPAAAGKTARGDYVVAVVNNDPVTNFEVNQHARELAQEIAASRGTVPPREVLLRRALDDIILKKAAIQSVRDTTMQVTDEEIANAEKLLASQQNLSPQDFRRGVMAQRRIRESEYRKELTEQLMLQKMRDTRTGMAAERVTELDALHWLRTHKPGDMRVVENRARHILLPVANEAEAQKAAATLADVRKRVAANKLDFAGAARELSKDGSAAQGGDLGWAPEGVFVPEFQEQVSALQPGQMSQPFLSRFGVHLVQLLDRRSSPMTQDQQLQAARNAVRQQKSQEALQKWESEVRAQAYIEMREAPR